jgi:hypothetical protein
VSDAKYIVFQLAEVAVPHKLFGAIVERITRPRGRVPRGQVRGYGQSGPNVVAVRPGCAVRANFGG